MNEPKLFDDLAPQRDANISLTYGDAKRANLDRIERDLDRIERVFYAQPGDGYYHTPDAVARMLDEVPDDRQSALFAEGMRRLEPTQWAVGMIRDAIKRRLILRRDQRGEAEFAKVLAIPDPEIRMEIQAQFREYSLDADALIEILPQLNPTDREDLEAVLLPARREPARMEWVEVPAVDEPASVKTGATNVVKRLAKKYAGSALGMFLDAQLKRERKEDKVIIEPARKAAK